MKKNRKKIRISGVISYGLLILLAAVIAVPLYLTVVNAFKGNDMIVQNPLAFPIPFVLDHLQEVFTNPNIHLGEMYLNSICITFFGTVICILVSSMAGYYLARTKSRISRFLYIFFLFGLMVPYVIVYVPLVSMFKDFGFTINLPALIFIFASGSISFSVFMYEGFIKSVSAELEEAAIMDGAGQGVIFFRIILPLVKQCTTTVAIFIGLSMWNDFMTPLIMGQVQTITVGIYTAIGPHASDWGMVFSYVLLAAVPVIVLYLAAQKQFIEGLTAGALKG